MVKRIALFIDADNISAKFGKQIIDALESRGEVFIRRIYGNWEKISLHGWNDCILNFSLRAIQQPDFATGKNATDMSLTIDAMDALYGGKVEVFALVSNDSDFTPLAIRLREGGMNIIGMGNGNASNAFRSACHEFIDLDAPAEVKPAQITAPQKKVSTAKKSSAQISLFDDEKISQPSSKVVPIIKNFSPEDNLQPLHDTLRETAKTQGDSSGFVSLNHAGQILREKNLSIKGSGHSTLSKFVAAFPNLYEVRKLGTIVSYRCKQYKTF